MAEFLPCIAMPLRSATTYRSYRDLIWIHILRSRLSHTVTHWFILDTFVRSFYCSRLRLRCRPHTFPFTFTRLFYTFRWTLPPLPHTLFHHTPARFTHAALLRTLRWITYGCPRCPLHHTRCCYCYRFPYTFVAALHFPPTRLPRLPCWIPLPFGYLLPVPRCCC